MVLLIFLIFGASACGSRSAPAAGSSTGALPDLRGHRVMVFPTQGVQGLTAAPDDELAYALRSHGEGVGWILPAELRQLLARSPGLDVRLDALPVGVFLRAEVNRIGDPLFGYLRRLAALSDSDIALIPIEVRARPESQSAGAAVEIAAALLSARTGHVFWFGIVDGDTGTPEDPAAVASAAEALARVLVR